MSNKQERRYTLQETEDEMKHGSGKDWTCVEYEECIKAARWRREHVQIQEGETIMLTWHKPMLKKKFQPSS